jgi:hypothetical protein
MSEFTLEKANAAWEAPVTAYLRDPSPEELAALTPELSDEERANMSVGDLQDMQMSLWKKQQVRNVVGLLRKEAAFARRNEHHVLNGIFGKEFYNSLTQEQKDALKARFNELNEAVKAEF